MRKRDREVDGLGMARGEINCLVDFHDFLLQLARKVVDEASGADGDDFVDVNTNLGNLLC